MTNTFPKINSPRPRIQTPRARIHLPRPQISPRPALQDSFAVGAHMYPGSPATSCHSYGSDVSGGSARSTLRRSQPVNTDNQYKVSQPYVTYDQYLKSRIYIDDVHVHDVLFVDASQKGRRLSPRSTTNNTLTVDTQ